MNFTPICVLFHCIYSEGILSGDCGMHPFTRTSLESKNGRAVLLSRIIFDFVGRKIES